ncbi:MAG: hypothetical protein AAF430_23845 [Myxococcota bacterium]
MTEDGMLHLGFWALTFLVGLLFGFRGETRRLRHLDFVVMMERHNRDEVGMPRTGRRRRATPLTLEDATRAPLPPADELEALPLKRIEQLLFLAESAYEDRKRAERDTPLSGGGQAGSAGYVARQTDAAAPLEGIGAEELGERIVRLRREAARRRASVMH